MPSDAADDERVIFGVPKKGRIHTEVMNILRGAGLDAHRPDRLDVAFCKDLPVKLVFLPASDIPSYVMDGHVDLGITGADMLEEAKLEHSSSKDPHGNSDD
jgi:ATP phosphoribosyltransferase